jgi:hypothetical protein
MSFVRRTIKDPKIAASFADDPEPTEPAAGQTITKIRPLLGLGDLVYRVAHPIGCAIDRLTKLGAKRWHTKLCGCFTCSLRRQRWNAYLPDVRRWNGGWQLVWRRFWDAKRGLEGSL